MDLQPKKWVRFVCHVCTSEFSVSVYILHSSSESKGNLDSNGNKGLRAWKESSIKFKLNCTFISMDYISEIFSSVLHCSKREPFANVGIILLCLE